jgi:prepilin-type N-terminal cleavage/methylation domain-containing protein
MKIFAKDNQSGFTLIEFIVAFVVAAIVASMVYTYFGNALTQSSAPIARLRNASNLERVMENIITDYDRLNKINLRYKWRHTHPYQVGDVVLPTDIFNNNVTSKIANNGRYYVCTVAGTSGSSTITWPVTGTPGLTTGGTVTEGSVTWRELGYVWKAGIVYPTNSIVVPAINNGHFYRGGDGTTSSGSSDPDEGANDWTITEGGTENDGSLTWTEVGTILQSNVLTDNLSTHLSTADYYGTGYTVYQNVFIGLDESTMQETTTYSEKNLLKVTIKNNDSAETLTQIFTIR